MNAIYTQIYLLPLTKEYIEVFTMEPKPNDALLSILKRVPYQKLSPYKEQERCGCFYIVKNINPNPYCHTEFLPVDDLPILFDYLLQRGYEIDTRLTKMLIQGKSAATKRNLVCYIRYPKEESKV